MPLGFLAHLQKRKIKDLGDETVQISKSVCFLRSIANLCFEELGLINRITKNQLSISVLSPRSVKIFAHKSISTREFCKDMQKFACFRVFGTK